MKICLILHEDLNMGRSVKTERKIVLLSLFADRFITKGVRYYIVNFN